MNLGANYINEMVKTSTDSMKFENFSNYAKQVKSLSDIDTNPKDIKEAADQLEGVFMSQLLGFMFNTVDVDPNFGGGFAEESVRGMMIDEYGKVMAKSGGIGISESIQKSLLAMQVGGQGALGAI